MYNFHKVTNNDKVNTTKIKKGDYRMNIFESLSAFVVGAKERAAQKMLQCLMTRREGNGWYKRFSGKSKTFKKNKRRGL